jgi:hypothetical protein
MMICVVGTSTAFAYWAFAVAAHALEEAAGEIHRVHCTSVQEMHTQWQQRGGRSVLFTTDFLEENLSQLIIESGAPIVALVDSAELAIATAAKLRNLSFLGAIRHASLYISSLADVVENPSTIVFGRAARSALVKQFVPRFLRALGQSDDPDLASRVMRRICPDEALWDTLTVDESIAVSQAPVDVQDVLPQWSKREREAFSKIAADYQYILDRLPGSQFTWPAAILHGAAPEYSTEKPLDLMGPARLLIWGPYMHLPKGKWTACMEFEVLDNLSRNTVMADVLIGGSFAGLGEFDLPSRGIFSWNLKFEVTDITKAIEVRLTLSKSAIEGSLFLREVRCSIEQDPSAPEPPPGDATPVAQRPRKSKPGASRSPSTTNSP